MLMGDRCSTLWIRIYFTLFATTSLMDRTKPSAIKMKRKGERGSPYRMSQEGEQVLEGEPLIKMEKKDEEVRERTHLV